MEKRSTAMTEQEAAEQHLAGYANWILFGPAFVLFCLGGLSNIMVPGVYMDAVNPDYMVVRLLNPATDVPVWIVPGNLVFGLFPIIVQIYHGALPFYVGLPVYALFGTGIVGIRLANLLFGLIVIVAAGFFLRAFRVRPVIAGLCLAALALDPGFIFSFRTQFYITLLPCALSLSSVALIEHRKLILTPRIVAAAGFLAGFAVYGYFIYAFLLPVAALHALWRCRCSSGQRRLVLWWVAGLVLGGSPYVLGMFLILMATGRVHGYFIYAFLLPVAALLALWRCRCSSGQRRLVLWWVAGLVLGGSPYVLGMFLILRAAGGVHGFLGFLASTLNGLSIFSSQMTIAERAKYFVDMVSWTLLDVGPSSMMLHKTLPLSFPAVKTLLLLAVPALGFITSLIRAPRSPGLLVVAGVFAGMAALVGMFGNHLWLHHAVLLLPVMYIALALALALNQLVTRFFPWRDGPAFVVGLVLFLPLLAGNAVDRQAIFFELQRTGGVGLASDAIERFAEESLQSRVPTYAFFPDWGVMMPFEMVTRGSIPLTTEFTPENAVQTLCGGRDVLLAYWKGRIQAGYLVGLTMSDGASPTSPSTSSVTEFQS